MMALATETPSAAKRGRNPAFPFVPVIVFRKGEPDQWTWQIRGKAFKTRDEAVEYAARYIAKREANSAAFQARRAAQAEGGR